LVAAERGTIQLIRVVHIITGLGRGGAEGSLTGVVARLDPARFHNTVVSLTDEGAFGARIRAAGIEVHSLGLRRGLVDPRGLVRLAMLLRALNPDLVQTWMYHADLLGLLASGLAGRPPVVWNVRCSNMEFRRYSRLTRMVVWTLARLSLWPAAVVVNSRAGQFVHESLGYRPRRWAPIPNGFDAEKLRPDAEAPARLRASLKIARDTVVIGHVARVDPMKDHAGFLEAAVRVAVVRPLAHFVLVGTGTQALAPLANRLGLEARIHLLGERDDIAGLMPGFDVLCLSSAFGEGFPNVLGEALACGVPCVTTDVGDAAAIVQDCGRVVRPSDPSALAAALLDLIDLGAGARAELGRAGRQRILEIYSMSSVVGSYERLYKDLVLPASVGARGR
jgi:glycosyltransferase involved in cell wall biosynthesis